MREGRSNIEAVAQGLELYTFLTETISLVLLLVLRR